MDGWMDGSPGRSVCGHEGRHVLCDVRKYARLCPLTWHIEPCHVKHHSVRRHVGVGEIQCDQKSVYYFEHSKRVTNIQIIRDLNLSIIREMSKEDTTLHCTKPHHTT